MAIKTSYTLAELEAMPTLCVGQADNLKVETEYERVWLSRCGAADGMAYDHQVTVERYDPRTGGWRTSRTYQARAGARSPQ